MLLKECATDQDQSKFYGQFAVCYYCFLNLLNYSHFFYLIPKCINNSEILLLHCKITEASNKAITEDEDIICQINNSSLNS